MDRFLRALVVYLACAAASWAQPSLAPGELARIPLADALVLDPSVGWSQQHTETQGHTWLASLDVAGGRARATIAEAGKYHPWHRPLANHIDPIRYSVAVVTYRASGLAAIDMPLLSAEGMALLRNSDVLADGKVHEAVVDLRELEMEDLIGRLVLSPHCGDPGPAVFELLGLRFEAAGNVPPADPAEAAEVRLRVVGRNREPIPGALVTVDADLLNGARSATSDADGNVVIQTVGTPGPGRVARVTKEGMAPVDAGSVRSRDVPERVLLLAGTRYGGTVRNEDGEPVPDVSVWFGVSSVSEDPKGRSWSTVVLTDAAGRWLSPVFPDEPRVSAPILRHPDYCEGHGGLESIAELRQGKAKMVILRGATVQGTVLDPDGQPVKGAAVRFETPNTWNRRAALETDAEGRFVARGLPVGKREFLIQHAAFAPALLELDLGTGDVEGEVRLERPNTLVGHVVDTDGKPVAGARIAVESWRGNRLLAWEGRSQADGMFLWPSAPRDAVRVRIWGLRQYLAMHDCPVLPDTDNALVLPPALRLSGTVTDKATGKPVAGGNVSYVLSPPADWQRRRDYPDWFYNTVGRVLRVKDDGTYEIPVEAAAPGWTAVVQVSAAGYQRVLSRALPIDQGDQTCDLALSREEEVTGTVLRPDGQPAVGASVYLVRSNGVVTLENGTISHASGEQSVTLGRDGQFRFPAQNRKWRIAAVSDDGYVEAHKDDFPADGKLVLVPWSRAEGTCKLDGKPVRDCRVEVMPSMVWRDHVPPRINHSFWTRTDADGRFVMPRLPARLVTLQLSLGERRREGPPAPLRNRVVEAAPGKACQVDFGGRGRAVVGALALPTGIAGPVAWEKLWIVISPRVATKLERPKPPDGWEDLSMEEKGKYLQTDEGKAYLAALMAFPQARQRAVRRSGLPFCCLSAGKGGRFRVPDLPAGAYAASGLVQLPVAAGEDPKTGVVLTFAHEFTVPETESAPGGEPLDLGTLKLKRKE